MNTSHLLNQSSTFLHGYLASTNPNTNMGVSQSLVFYDKSRQEQDMMELKKEVNILKEIKSIL